MEIPGRKTVLYRLAGPGEQNFEVEEIIAEVTNANLRTSRNWREGVLTTGAGFVDKQFIGIDQAMVGESLGGMAFVKPTIIPGASFGRQPVSGSSAGRTDIILYVVQSGDVLGAIAVKYGISVQSILAVNNLTIRSYIRPGDTLKIYRWMALYML